MTYLLGIDIGTSSVKALIWEVDGGQVLATASREYPVQQPQPGYAEQNPDDWWQATQITVREALQQVSIPADAIKGIGLSGQMHGTVCLDQAHKPLRPAIIWADTRSKAQCERLLTISPEMLAQHAPGRPAAGFMGPTLMWLAEHEPETLAQTAAVLLPKDYVRYCMTGELATEVSDAASTWLLDVRSGQWSDWLVEQCALEMRYLPPVLQSTDVAGTLHAKAAAALGLPVGIPVVAGCADQPAQALGYGLYATGTALVTVGTGGQVFYPLTEPRVDPALRYYVFNHAVTGYWYSAAATLSAGLSLRWLRDLLGLGQQADAYPLLSDWAAQVDAGANGLLFLPYLAGERTPHFDPDASGLFLGLRLHHTPAHLARAVMEGVAFSLLECLTLLPQTPEKLILSGGAAASPVWRQILTDVFDQPLWIAGGSHHACIGAALVAGVGTGVYADFAVACQQLEQPAKVTEQNPSKVAFYAARCQLYNELYAQLQGAMHNLISLS